jgi:hypothetical protein
MEDKPFDTPVGIDHEGRKRDVISVAQAQRLLMDTGWPVRGPRHEDAVAACLKVIDGHRSATDARVAFTEAAREAGVLA